MRYDLRLCYATWPANVLCDMTCDGGMEYNLRLRLVCAARPATVGGADRSYKELMQVPRLTPIRVRVRVRGSLSRCHASF